jgi:hypothetical protein
MAQELYKTLEKAGTLLVAEMRTNLRKERANATGTLSDSISWTIEENVDGLKLLIGMEDYGPILDAGRGKSRTGGPQQQWRQRIIQWMRAKGITPKAGVTMESAAFLITRKINQRGYKPKPFIQKSVDDVLNKIIPDLEEDMVKIIEEKLIGR